MLRCFLLSCWVVVGISVPVAAADSLWNPFSHENEQPAESSASGTHLTLPDFDLFSKLPKPTLSMPEPIVRFNQSTKQFFGKAKQALAPPKLTLPEFDLLPPFGDKDESRVSHKSDKESLFGSLFSSEPEPPRPMTASDFIGLPRPE